MDPIDGQEKHIKFNSSINQIRIWTPLTGQTFLTWVSSLTGFFAFFLFREWTQKALEEEQKKREEERRKREEEREKKKQQQQQQQHNMKQADVGNGNATSGIGNKNHNGAAATSHVQQTVVPVRLKKNFASPVKFSIMYLKIYHLGSLCKYYLVLLFD